MSTVDWPRPKKFRPVGIVARLSIALSVISLMSLSRAQAQQTVLPSEVVVQGSVRHEITSKLNGISYRLSVFLPRGYESGNDRYPVLYVIPGETFGSFFAQLTRYLGQGDIPKLIVVGIDFTDNDSYTLDLPTAGVDPHWSVPENRGAANFLSFLLGQVKPFIDTKYRTSPQDNGIFGHSLGGFFALYAFLHGQSSFQHVYASSPSTVWQNNRLLSDIKEIVAQGKGLSGRVFVDQGSLEEFDGRLEAIDQAVTSAHLPQLRWNMRVASNQSHRTVAFADGIDALYSIYGPEMREVSEEELSALTGTYCTEKNNHKFSLEAKERRLFLIGSPDSDDDPQSRTVLLTSEPNVWFIRYLDYKMTVMLTGEKTYRVTFHLQPTPGPNGNVLTSEVSASLCNSTAGLSSAAASR
jgi:predicted alpha/beta superfamily hydrolase